MEAIKIECCKCEAIHNDLCDTARKALPEDKYIQSVSELFKALGDKTRLKILYALLPRALCVCDIAAALAMTHSAVSHQLAVLKRTRLVESRREGKVVFYQIADQHVEELLQKSLLHAGEVLP